jgi:hypothetical protein
MRYLLIMTGCIISFVLSGCAGQTPVQHERPQPYPHAYSKEDASLSAERANKDKKLFLDCLSDYARAESGSSAAIDDVADSAAENPECRGHLDNYRKNLESYYANMGWMNAQSGEESMRVEEQAHFLAKRKSRELVEIGRQQVNKLLIDLRQQGR